MTLGRSLKFGVPTIVCVLLSLAARAYGRLRKVGEKKLPETTETLQSISPWVRTPHIPAFPLPSHSLFFRFCFLTSVSRLQSLKWKSPRVGHVHSGSLPMSVLPIAWLRFKPHGKEGRISIREPKILVQKLANNAASELSFINSPQNTCCLLI